MKYKLSDYEITLARNILDKCNCSEIKTTHSFIEFKYKDQIFVITNSSKYQYHITVKNTGNTYASWKNIEELLLWFYKNKDEK